jgi:hypothetical protein
MNDVPETVGKDIYIVRRVGLDRRVVFECPCRCHRRIDLNLAAGQNPHWNVHHENGVLTIEPSIWLRSNPCGSHFFVRKNRIIWV